MTNENITEDEIIVDQKDQKPSKIKEKFQKVKSWCKEHKGEIIKDALFIGAGAAAVVIAKIATNNSEDEYMTYAYDDSVEISDKTDEEGNPYCLISAKSSDDDDSEESDDSNVESTEE